MVCLPALYITLFQPAGFLAFIASPLGLKMLSALSYAHNTALVESCVHPVPDFSRVTCTSIHTAGICSPSLRFSCHHQR
jgi:hypothetical protein